jgi:hypothetical protein
VSARYEAGSLTEVADHFYQMARVQEGYADRCATQKARAIHLARATVWREAADMLRITTIRSEVPA